MPGSWENSADAYAQSFARLCAGTVEEILVRLGPGDRDRLLLDVGTGPGTVAAAARTRGFTAIGMDSDASMVALANRGHPELAFVRAALPVLPSRDRVFDAVTANFVINHTPDPRRAMRELFRVIRPGGCLVATTWPSQTLSLNEFWNEVMRHAEVSPPVGTRLPAELDFERTTDGFAGILVDAGFGQIDCQQIRWTFEITPDDLWIAVEAGISVVGRTYLAQDSVGQERIRSAYAGIIRDRVLRGLLAFPAIAIVASARVGEPVDPVVRRS